MALELKKHESGTAGLLIFLTGSIHGDEVGGSLVIEKIFERLDTQPLLRGSLYALPRTNEEGIKAKMRELPETGEDLNRLFPGKTNGTLGEKLAHEVFSKITESKPTLVLDLHNDWNNSIAYVEIDRRTERIPTEAHEKAVKAAFQSGLAVISEENTAGLEGSLSQTLLKHGIPALTLELGGVEKTSEQDITAGADVVFNILAHLGMTKPSEKPNSSLLPELVKEKVLIYFDRPRPTKEGVLRFLVKPGEIVEEGQALCEIIGPSGSPTETLSAEAKASVLGYTDEKLAHPGDTVIAFGLINQKRICKLYAIA